jgi:hypothetical protein
MEKFRLITNTARRVMGMTCLLLSFILLFSCQTKNRTMERGTVKGMITDSSGAPIADAVVMIVSGPAEFNDIASVSSDDGEFYLSNISIPGTYVLQVQHEGNIIKKQVNIQSLDSTVTIRF